LQGIFFPRARQLGCPGRLAQTRDEKGSAIEVGQEVACASIVVIVETSDRMSSSIPAIAERSSGHQNREARLIQNRPCDPTKHPLVQ
jgi:hypothetical protein